MIERDEFSDELPADAIEALARCLLKMAIDGQVIHVELDSVKDMNRLLSNATNNINQIAKRVNESSDIYQTDIDEIKARQEEIWEQQKNILQKIISLLDIGQTKIKKDRRKAGAADEQSEA